MNLETGFAISYSFLAVDLKTDTSRGHGGEAGIPNHLPGFGIPTLRMFYDRRAGQNIDMDDFRKPLCRGFLSFLSRPHSPC